MADDNDGDSTWLAEILTGQRFQRRGPAPRLGLHGAAEALPGLIERIDRLELVCQTLLEVVISRGVATAEEVSVLMAQIDLRDGVEDGAVGKDGGPPRHAASLCARCERPVNPARGACVYCGAQISAAAAQAPRRAARMIRCGECQRMVDERETYFTGSGLRCDRCFHPG